MFSREHGRSVLGSKRIPVSDDKVKMFLLYKRNHFHLRMF